MMLRVLRLALTVFGIWLVGVFSAQVVLPCVHLRSPVLVIGPSGEPAGEVDQLILADVCTQTRIPK